MNPLQALNTDKAYILGLVIGGGEISGSRLVITLPYRNWGSMRIDPQRAGEISNYILMTLRPIWKTAYGVEISYTIENNSWKIYCVVDDSLRHDLHTMGLPTAGKIKEIADISKLSLSLDNEEKIKRFIAGLTDTVGSLAQSHRNRVDGNQIISYEFSGKNFKLVADLAELFFKINCEPDQILWNHPNFHSGANRYYRSWRKGFKLRIRLRDYMVSGNFVSQAKKLSAQENLLLQSQTTDARGSRLSINGRTSLHVDERSEWLPANVRGLHFIHYTHLLHNLGAPIGADAYDFIKTKLEKAESLITPFTLLTKGTKSEIYEIIENEEYLRSSIYIDELFELSSFERALIDNEVDMVYGIDKSRGFPKANVLHAVMYVVLAQIRRDQLMGTRILGTISEQFKNIKQHIPDQHVIVRRPTKGTCLVIESGNYAALVGYVDDDFNKTVIDIDKHALHLRVKNPSYDDCIDI